MKGGRRVTDAPMSRVGNQWSVCVCVCVCFCAWERYSRRARVGRKENVTKAFMKASA